MGEDVLVDDEDARVKPEEHCSKKVTDNEGERKNR